MSKVTKIVLAGEGGQGVQKVAEILAEAANMEGKNALYIPNFGVEQRGGVSIAFVQIGEDEISFPKFSKGDIVIALSNRAVKRTEQYLCGNTVLVYDSTTTPEKPEVTAKDIIGIPALELARTKLHPVVFNIIILGTVIGATNVVTRDDAVEALKSQLGHKFEKDEKLRELNLQALDTGISLMAKRG